MGLVGRTKTRSLSSVSVPLGFTSMSQWIIQIATSYRGAVAAFAGGGELEGRVFVWNLATGSREADLTTEFDRGGWRLAINQAGSRCAVGSWNGRSLSMHNVLTGKLSGRRTL